MKLEITERQKEGVTILDLTGRLVAGGECETLREIVRRLAGAGVTRIILNLEHVAYIDSTGLGTMVLGYTTMTRAGGGLKLLNLTKREVELLILTKLTTVFEIFNDEQSAVNSFFPGREIKRFDILSFIQEKP
jgi:anti-sigma B factor antagonist